MVRNDPSLDPHLLNLFEEINAQHFDGFLAPPQLKWNTRLKTVAGRFFPGARRFLYQRPPVIEVATYLKEKGEKYIVDTLAHEMIHYWLWVRKRPFGHTAEFHRKMKEMGVSRYNPVPQLRHYQYLYECKNCQKKYPARKKLKNFACALCCKKHTSGKYHSDFQLIFIQNLTPSESSKLLETLHQTG